MVEKGGKINRAFTHHSYLHHLTVFATWQKLLSVWKGWNCGRMEPVDTQHGLVHLSICICECICVYAVITDTSVVVSLWVSLLNARVWETVRKSALKAHVHSWLCVHATISTTQRAFRISAGWYRLAAKAFTCIVDNDGGSSCGCVRGLPYKVWDRKEGERWKTEFESIICLSAKT